MPSHYLNQYCLIVNWSLRKKLQWNLIKNIRLLIHENAFKTVCEIVSFLSLPQCVNKIFSILESSSSKKEADSRPWPLSFLGRNSEHTATQYGSKHSSACLHSNLVNKVHMEFNACCPQPFLFFVPSGPTKVTGEWREYGEKINRITIYISTSFYHLYQLIEAELSDAHMHHII